MEWKIDKATEVFGDLWNAINTEENGERKYNIFGLEGGSRSSKTTSIIQALLIYALQSKEPLRISIFRKKKTWCRDTLWFDFKKYLISEGLFDINNQRDMEYRIFNCVFEFGGLDDEQRIHGRTQDIVWLNESIECAEESFDQLEQRTSQFIVMDWNPKASKHWSYKVVDNRKDALLHHSTILSNPFVPKNMRRKVMSYEPYLSGSYKVKNNKIYYNNLPISEDNQPPPHKENNQNQTANLHNWKIYGLGLRSSREGLIFKNWRFGEFDTKLPYLFVMDFGFHPDPTTLTKMAVDRKAKKIYIDEKFYEYELNTTNLLKKTGQSVKSRKDLIVCDTNQGITRADLLKAGFNVIKANKGIIVDDIKVMEDYEFILTPSSKNAETEFDSYVWNEKNVLPIDDFNHIIDPTRYGFRELTRTRRGVRRIA